MSYQRDFERRVRVGMVGVGAHAYRNILPALHYLPVELVAMCDRNLDLAQRTAKEYGVAATFSSLAEMIDGVELDAVLLCVGEQHHPALAIEAFAAGLHVFMEKPSAPTARDAEAMLAARGDRICVVGFKKAFMPATQKAVELFGDDQYGPIATILGSYPIGVPENGAEIIAAGKSVEWLNCCHPLAFMLEVGGAVRSVTTHRSTQGGGACILEYVSGAVGVLHLAKGAAGSQPLERYTVVGKRAHLVVDNVERVTLQRGIPFAYQTTTNFAPPGTDHGAVVWEPQNSLGTLENKSDFTQGMVAELGHFFESVLDGRPAVKGTLEFALEIMRIYESAMLSNGVPVAISTVQEAVPTYLVQG